MSLRMHLHQPTRRNQSGFSGIEVLLIVLVVAAVAVTGLVVYQHHKPRSANKVQAVNTSPSTNTKPISKITTQPVYANWPVYSNSKYGFSYNYPTYWIASSEVTTDPKTSATRQEFGTGLKLKTDTKYNDTVVLDVLDEPLQTAEAWYDQYYAQTSINVIKTTGSLKGKQSIQYDFKAPTYESKLYLFAVGSKTYFFESVNEALNVQNNSNYWSDFNNTIASLAIQ
jgi:hypothetical protein